MSSEIDTGTIFEKFFRKKGVDLDKIADYGGPPMFIGDGRAPHIQVVIWKDLPDFSVQILEKAGYNHYNKQDDSVEMVLDRFGNPTDALGIGELKEWIKNLSNTNSNNNIPTKLWKQLPDSAIDVLETVGYTKYDRKTDSIVFVQK